MNGGKMGWDGIGKGVKRDTTRTHLRENSILLTRNLPLLHRLPHPIIAPLHQPPLQLDRITQIPIRLQLTNTAQPRAQRLQLAVELGILSLRQQKQQIKPSDLVLLLPVRVRSRDPAASSTGADGPLEFVEALQLADVAQEGVGVLGADRGKRALLVDLAGEREERRVGGGAGRGRGQGVELQEQQLGFGEKGGGIGVGEGGGGGLELGEDLGELSFCHFGRLCGLVVIWGSGMCVSTIAV